MSNKPPMAVQHVWVKSQDKAKRILGVHRCGFCGMWTANLPLYRYDVCPKADRRVATADRRRNDRSHVDG